MTAPSSPGARRLQPPSWLDGRLVLGVLLVLVSVVVGARVLAGADRSQLVWAAATDLAPGSELQPEDLQPAQVRLFDSADRYLSASEPVPAGYVVRQGLRTGELLPAAGLAQVGVDVDLRHVTVPVEAGHLPPDLAADDQVDVWVTRRDAATAGSAGPAAGDSGADGAAPDPAAATAADGPRAVLTGVAVQRVGEGGGFAAGSGTTAVVLQVAPADVPVLVEALSTGRIDLVRVPGSSHVLPSLTPATPGR